MGYYEMIANCVDYAEYLAWQRENRKKKIKWRLFDDDFRLWDGRSQQKDKDERSKDESSWESSVQQDSQESEIRSPGGRRACGVTNYLLRLEGEREYFILKNSLG